MAFGNHSSTKGQKKGPRSHQVSHKNKQVKLRPVPDKPFLEATNDDNRFKGRTIGTEGQFLGEGDLEVEEAEEEEEEEECSYRKETQANDQKPLFGNCISVSGCAGIKATLLHTANQLGAVTESSLLAHVTHLITDSIGSEKYEAAVENGIRVMNPTWIEAVRTAWTSADDSIDFDQLEIEHTRKPFEGLSICVTGFARGEHRDSIRQLLAEHGAYITPLFLHNTDILLIASPDSPHSQTVFPKITEFKTNKKKYPNCRAIWEGWIREVIQVGGIRARRMKYWEWREGEFEPAAAAANLEGGRRREGGLTTMMERRNMSAVSSTMLPSTLRTMMDPNLGSTSTGLPKKKQKVVEQRERKGLGGESQALDSLKSHYVSNATTATTSNITSTSTRNSIASTSKVTSNPLRTSTSTSTTTKKSSDSRRPTISEPYVPLDSTGFAAIGTKGKSVIKAVSYSRNSTSFPTLPPPLPIRDFIRTNSTRKEEGLFSKGGGSGGGDDSAYFEGGGNESIEFENIGNELDLPEIRVAEERADDDNEEEEEDLPIFKGLTFSLVGLEEDSCGKVKEAIESRGGKVWIEKRMREADWICVPHFGAPLEYLNSTDTRIITPGWIELCSFSDEVITETSNILLARPIPYAVPIPGGEKLLVHPTGYTAPSAKHIKRFVEALGGKFTDTLTKFHTHLIHADFDQLNHRMRMGEGEEVGGYKVEKAREWGVEIVGMNWLREFGRKGAEKRDGVAKKDGKGKEKEKEKGKEINGDDDDDDDTMMVVDSNSVEDGDEQVLEGCTIFISKQCESRRRELNEIVQKLGGNTVANYSKEVTHLIHIGRRKNETFKEFKSAKMDKAFIVHFAWLEDSLTNHRRLSESDYPHTYDPKKGPQLAGLVSSPNRIDRTTSASQSQSHSQSFTSDTTNSRVPSRKNSMIEKSGSIGKFVGAVIERGEEDESEREDNEDLESRDRTSTSKIGSRKNSKSSIPPPLPSAVLEEAEEDQDWDMGFEPDHQEESNTIGKRIDLEPIESISHNSILPQVEPEAEVEVEAVTVDPPALPLQSSSLPPNVSSPKQGEPASDELPDAIVPIKNDATEEQEVGEDEEAPPATARTLLKKQTSAMLASFEKKAVETGMVVKKSRFGRKRSLVDTSASEGSSSHLSPPRTRLSIVEPMEETQQFTQWEEESMCVRYEDPNSKAIMEKIQAALKANPTIAVESGKTAREGESKVVEKEGESLNVAESSLKRTKRKY